MCSTCDCDKSTPATGADPNPRVASDNKGLKCCRKCGADPFIILDKVHVECKNCFLESCNRKLRSTIGKSKLLRNNDPILIAYSGGQSSAALLGLVKNSIEYDTRREQKFRPSILHIDTQAIFDRLKEESSDQVETRREKLQLLLNSVSKLYPDWPLYWSTLEMFTMESDANSHPSFMRYHTENDLNSTECDRFLNNAQAIDTLSSQLLDMDLTDRQRFIQDCTAGIINRVAAAINASFGAGNHTSCFKYVLTASSATQLANSLLVDVICGQGATIRSTVNICDTRPSVPIMRPMRDFSKKEIAFYLKAKGLNFHVQPNLMTFANRKASIQTVTEAFLSKLYVDYPSTYSTLLRTGNKMQD